MKVLLTGPVVASKELEFCDIGLGYLASGLRKTGHEVKMFLRSMKKEQFCSLLTAEKPDILGIKVITSDVYETIQTAKLTRQVSNSIIVIGGPHVSGDPLRALTDIPADYGIQDEADRSFPEFVNFLAKRAPLQKMQSLPGLIYRKDGAVAANPPEFINDLDSLPFPAWDLMPPAQYQSLLSRKKPAAGIMTSRGCTNHCMFCAEAHKKLRYPECEKRADRNKISNRTL